MKAQYYPAAYPLRGRAGDWIVVIPVSGRLSPILWPTRFRTRPEAEKWLACESGRQCIGDVQTRRALRSA